MSHGPVVSLSRSSFYACGGKKNEIRIMLDAERAEREWKKEGYKGAWWHRHVKSDQVKAS